MLSCPVHARASTIACPGKSIASCGFSMHEVLLQPAIVGMQVRAFSGVHCCSLAVIMQIHALLPHLLGAVPMVYNFIVGDSQGDFLHAVSKLA